MKTHPSVSSTILVLCFALGLGVRARAAQPEAAGSVPTLEVQVNVPPSWRPMLDERIADALVSDVQDVFQRRGYHGPMKEVSSLDAPDPGANLLTIDLTEWRIDPVGNIDCTFTATLQTAHTSRRLGLFTETAFRWMSGPGRFGLGDAFGSAAEGAIQQLYDSLARTKLVPGLTPG